MNWVSRWASLFLCFGSVWSFAQPNVELFSDAQYQGTGTVIRTDIEDVAKVLTNTRFGSLTIDCSCSVILFPEAGYQGAGIVVRENVVDLAATSLAGRIGSLQLHLDLPSSTAGPNAVAAVSSSSAASPASSQLGQADQPEQTNRPTNVQAYAKRGVVLFAEPNHQGKGMAIYEDEGNLVRHFGKERPAQSIVVPAGFQAYLYPKTRFRGKPILLKEDHANLTALEAKGFALGSIRVSWLDPTIPDDERPYITLYRGKQFSGKSERFFGDDHDLSDNPIGDNSVQSFSILRGCVLVLYENKYFRGRAIAFKKGHGNLALTVLGAQQVSSLRIEWEQ